MNSEFFQRLEKILAPERLKAYRHDDASPAVTLARYLLNMALCEALYSPLQVAEIALRNTIHTTMTARFKRDDWFHDARLLTPWQEDTVDQAYYNLVKEGKQVIPGRMVAELHFGFWSGFFNKAHARTGVGALLAKQAFPNAPLGERDLRKIDQRWNSVRTLRNRVFHHERILHWTDLDQQHSDILNLIGWISADLRDMATALDRFSTVRAAGLTPWIDKIRQHWPRQ